MKTFSPHPNLLPQPGEGERGPPLSIAREKKDTYLSRLRERSRVAPVRVPTSIFPPLAKESTGRAHPNPFAGGGDSNIHFPTLARHASRVTCHELLAQSLRFT
jgi:hypothetical protein